jgi:Ca-activated chloride channel family protein
LFLLALTSLVFALGRPVATVMIPSNKATVILAVDVSRSMCSTDIPPNRLEVAKDAALSFIRDNSSGRQVGIVAFAGFAELVQPPTTDAALLENAITNLTPARRTAIGSAIMRSLDALAEIDERVAPTQLNAAGSAQVPAAAEYVPHIIVLLTDGASNAGPFPLSAAELAVERGVRVYTIGFGTVNNRSPMNCGDDDPFGGGFGFGSPFGNSPFGTGGGGGGGGFRREIDEETLTQVASLTGGKYYVATSAGELQEVFRNLPTYVIATRETIEISVFFTAFAALIGLLAIFLALRWHPWP